MNLYNLQLAGSLYFPVRLAQYSSKAGSTFPVRLAQCSSKAGSTFLHKGKDLLLLPAQWLGLALVPAQWQGLFEYVAFHARVPRSLIGASNNGSWLY